MIWLRSSWDILDKLVKESLPDECHLSQNLEDEEEPKRSEGRAFQPEATACVKMVAVAALWKPGDLLGAIIIVQARDESGLE